MTDHATRYIPCEPHVWAPRWHPRYGWGHIIGHREQFGTIQEYRIEFENVGVRHCLPCEVRTEMPCADVIDIPAWPGRV